MEARDLTTLAEHYLEWLKVRGAGHQRLYNGKSALGRFEGWCQARGILEAAEVTRAILEAYQRWLFYYRQANGRPLAPRTQSQYLTTLKGFFSWMVKQRVLLANAAADLELPKTPRMLPRHVLSLEEVELLMKQPDVDDAIGLRDRAILEVFYSTGMRRMELRNLQCHDVDFSNGTVFIKFGKGQRDRVVPIGDRAMQWVGDYLTGVRPTLVAGVDEQYMFLSPTGTRIRQGSLSEMVSTYVKVAGIKKAGSCHMLRHTMATLMLERGADVRFIQVMLGHASIETTTIYTRVSVGKLKEVHDRTHPSAGGASQPATAGGGGVHHQDFMDVLDAEAAEEL